MSAESSGSPLDGILVLDMSQFLAGPSAALQLGDLGARVIKIERPDGGDLCRNLYLSDTRVDGDSTLFHAINRNKESFTANLKDPVDLEAVRRLIAKADVLIQNFRPGVIERLGLGYDEVRKINPGLVYASVSGFGPDGPWARLPGQDLLAQARSGVMWLTGSAGNGPVPIGLSVADMLAGHILSKGILAALVRRGVTGVGGRVETSLLEVLVDFQFELLTTYLNDGERPPRRARSHGANAYLSAPYGVYATSNGHLAIAMTPLDRLCELLGEPGLSDGADEFADRDLLLEKISQVVAKQTTEELLGKLEPAGIWVSPVLDWPALLREESFKALDMLQTLTTSHGEITTTASPLRVDGARAKCDRSAPFVGQHSEAIRDEFGIVD
ncbi:MAG: CaiB/BaiF CoA-transferase family protein [Sphingomonadaceae bacterium]